MQNYNIRFLSLFYKDYDEIIGYIEQTLKAPAAAITLTKDLFKSIDRLAKHPYINKIYTSVNALPVEIRVMMVKNYAVFYFVDEQNKTIKFYRILYGRRDFNQLI